MLVRFAPLCIYEQICHTLYMLIGASAQQSSCLAQILVERGASLWGMLATRTCIASRLSVEQQLEVARSELACNFADRCSHAWPTSGTGRSHLSLI